MRKAEDLTGRKFADGVITVLRRAENNKNRHAKWVCQCACGNTFEEYGLNLKAGRRVSCGCRRKAWSDKDMTSAQMELPSASLSRLKRGSDDPWQDLASAIVVVAVDDYRMALRDHMDGLQKSLEQFFFSDWYRSLTEVDPENLLRFLRREQSGDLSAVFI